MDNKWQGLEKIQVLDPIVFLHHSPCFFCGRKNSKTAAIFQHPSHIPCYNTLPLSVGRATEYYSVSVVTNTAKGRIAWVGQT